MDPPDMLVEGALQNHYKMIKQMKGAWDIKITTYLKILKLCAITEPLLKYFSLFMNFLLVFGPDFPFRSIFANFSDFYLHNFYE